jgi:protein-tyrosine phosphatase
MASPSRVYRVLFVCTGNTCRSPMAAAALRTELGTDADRVEVWSAGTAAGDGQPASDGSLEVTGADGLDLRSHRSRRLSGDLARSADVILAMEPRHRDAIEKLGVPRERVHVLSEWPEPGEPELPVDDPIGGSREAYEECWRRIRRHVKRLAPRVTEAARMRAAG